MAFSELLQTPFAALLVLGLATLDIWLTLQGQKFYRKHYARFVDVESYELNPSYVDAIKKNEYPFLQALRVGPLVGIVFVLQFMLATSPLAMVTYQVLVGALLSLFLLANAGHIANMLLYVWVGKHPEHLSGKISLKYPALLAQMRVNIFSWFFLLGVAFLIAPTYWLLGMLVGLFGMIFPSTRKERILVFATVLLLFVLGYSYIHFATLV